jgi:hypothetical protein
MLHCTARRAFAPLLIGVKPNGVPVLLKSSHEGHFTGETSDLAGESYDCEGIGRIEYKI